MLDAGHGMTLWDGGGKYLVFKILPASYCGARIFSRFSSNFMIQLDPQGRGPSLKGKPLPKWDSLHLARR